MLSLLSPYTEVWGRSKLRGGLMWFCTLVVILATFNSDYGKVINFIVFTMYIYYEDTTEFLRERLSELEEEE